MKLFSFGLLLLISQNFGTSEARYRRSRNGLPESYSDSYYRPSRYREYRDRNDRPDVYRESGFYQGEDISSDDYDYQDYSNSYSEGRYSKLDRNTPEDRNMRKKTRNSKQPHIVYVKADDMGWNDISWNNPKIRSPNLQYLGNNGVILDSFYAQPSCTPSRMAFNTGVYPFKIGYQGFPLDIGDAFGIPDGVKIVPEKLKEIGYSTHLIGKWHLGYCNENMTAFERGYDSFYGILLGISTYFTKIAFGSLDNILRTGFDFRDNTGVGQDVTTHQSILFRRRMLKIIDEHNPIVPLYLHYTAKLPHDPLEVPQEYFDMFPEIENQARRTFTAMVFFLDETIGELVKALKEKGMWEDTIFVFTSDNGGNPDNIHAGNNVPLRGSKGAYYEGGTRVPALIHGKGIERTGYRSQELLHITDLHNTLIKAAGGDIDTTLDSLNVWETLARGDPSPRTEMVYNLNSADFSTGGAIRVGDYKLIVGSPEITFLGSFNRTIVFPELVKEDDSVVIQNCGIPCVGELDVLELYNVSEDPSENNNLANEKPEIVQQLMDRLDFYRQFEVPPVTGVSDPASDPDNFGGVISPGWC